MKDETRRAPNSSSHLGHSSGNSATSTIITFFNEDCSGFSSFDLLGHYLWVTSLIDHSDQVNTMGRQSELIALEPDLILTQNTPPTSFQWARLHRKARPVSGLYLRLLAHVPTTACRGSKGRLRSTVACPPGGLHPPNLSPAAALR
jgi:hypothetical protein